jgi:hypothetical protein
MLSRMIEWIKKRAAEARRRERQKRDARFIASHFPELFKKLSDLMARSVEAFNAEFGEGKKIEQFERGVNRF